MSIDLFFKLPVSRFLAINIEGKIGELTVRRTSSFISEKSSNISRKLLSLLVGVTKVNFM